MKIAIGCDHAGYELKTHIIKLLNEMDYEVLNFGNDDPNDRTDDYPVYGARVAHCVADGKADLGILICGTGIGIGITANKVPGIRCVICSDTYSAHMSRNHNNANVLSIGARVVGRELALDIVRSFLAAPFEGGRHAARVEMINRVEKGEALE